MKADCKTAAVVFGLIIYVFLSYTLLLPSALGFATVRWRHSYLHGLCRYLCWVCQLRVKVVDPTGRMPLAGQGVLVVSNHISYLDAVVLMLVCPSSFITSVEIGETPVLGQLTRSAGCAFVERRRRMLVQKDLHQITELLLTGNNVILFPEGTTSDGMSILDFKSTLFEAAYRSRRGILPICLRYRTIDGQDFNDSNKTCVAWYGDMRFWPHLRQLMRVGVIEIEVEPLDFLAIRAGKSRKQAAVDARAALTQAYLGV